MSKIIRFNHGFHRLKAFFLTKILHVTSWGRESVSNIHTEVALVLFFNFPKKPEHPPLQPLQIQHRKIFMSWCSTIICIDSIRLSTTSKAAALSRGKNNNVAGPSGPKGARWKNATLMHLYLSDLWKNNLFIIGVLACYNQFRCSDQ